MGCNNSKVDHLPLVTLCRERKELIKAASDHRYALAAAHLSYLRSLKEVGDALCKFVDEELVAAGGGSSSPPGSPVLTLPSDEGKPRNKGGHKGKDSFSSTSISHSHSLDHSPVEEINEDSHLHLSSSGSESESEVGSSLGHIHMEGDSPERGVHPSYPYLNIQRGPPGPDPDGSSYAYPATNWGSPGETDAPYGYQATNWSPPRYQSSYAYPAADWAPPGEARDQSSYVYPAADWGPPGGSSSMYYMKRTGTPAQSMVYKEPERYQATSGQWQDSSSYRYPQSGNGGLFGFPSMGSPRDPSEYQYTRERTPPAPPPAPPEPPNISTWDFLNVFDTFDNGYSGYYSQNRYGVGSSTSSPDSKEVREREGIPDLEDGTDHEVLKDVNMEKNYNGHVNRRKSIADGTSRAVPLQRSKLGDSRAVPLQRNEDFHRAVPLQSSEGTSRAGPMQNVDSSSSTQLNESIPDTFVSNNSEEEYARKKGVSFEIDEAGAHEIDSSNPSSLTALSTHGTRDLQEVVKEIKDEFETASSYGKEVALLLEVGKLPYQPRHSVLKAIFSRIMYLVAPSNFSSHPPSRPSIRLSSRTMKMAKEYYEDAGKDSNATPGNLVSTLEELYEWEKKLYKEVKDEERLRLIYEKECNKLKNLDDHGAEISKIDATQASIRRLYTKIDVSIRAVDSISSRIHKLRDEELQPRLTELIYGLIRMWKYMLKCHQKQFQAIMESKIRSLRANTGFRRDSSLRATLELEMELLNWSSRFKNWITTQKAYIDALNGWLLKCIFHETEVTPDGVAPFSPSRIGAPPIFVTCNDWYQAMVRISENGVADAMQEFASSLHQLWERQDEEQRQRIKAEFLSRDFEKQIRTLRNEKERMEHDHDISTDKTAMSKASESGVSPLDDLKVDLDSMRKRLDEERVRHKEAIKQVHSAASSSLQAGLVPIFQTLENFTSEVLKAHEQVRFQSAGGSS